MGCRGRWLPTATDLGHSGSRLCAHYDFRNADDLAPKRDFRRQVLCNSRRSSRSHDAVSRQPRVERNPQGDEDGGPRQRRTWARPAEVVPARSPSPPFHIRSRLSAGQKFNILLVLLSQKQRLSQYAAAAW